MNHVNKKTTAFPIKRRTDAFWQKLKIPLLVGVCLIWGMTACTDDNSPEDSHAPAEPVIKPKGVPLDEPYTTLIGSEGGVITYFSPSGQNVKMEIPPAAVEEPTRFSIQSIGNTHDENSEMPAYRFGPEGLRFRKPIRISIQYGTEMDGNPKTRMVAFQRNDGVWCGVSTALNESQRLLAIETDHFSDWVWFDFISLRKNREAVSNGQQVELRLMEQVLGSLIPTNSIDSIPLAAMDEIGASGDFTIKNWRIMKGPGTLEPKINTHALKANAIYTAPAIINTYEDVEIQVEVDSKNGYIRDPNAPNGRRKFGKLYLITKIELIPDGFISLKLDGTPQNISQKGTAHLTNGNIYIRAEDQQQAFTITLECKGNTPGTYPGGNAAGQSQFLLTMQQGSQRYFLNNFYRDCNNEFIYNGNTSLSHVEGYVEGSFIGIAYPLNAPDCEVQEPTSVEFQFKIPRTN